MAKPRMRAGDWIVVLDGRKALFLANEGDEVYPNLKTREVREHQAPPDRDLSADRPGRVYQSAAPMRSAVEQTDRHDEEEENFVIGVANRLGEVIAAGETKNLIIAAPARVLGLMRQNSSDAVKSAIRAEVGRDLTRLPVFEIEQRLQKELAE